MYIVPWGMDTLTWLRILPRLLLDLHPPPTTHILYRGFVNVSLGRWRWVCILAIPVIQIQLVTLPFRYFFLLPSPPLFFLSSFFFLKSHCTTCQSSLDPSRILSTSSSPHLFSLLLFWTHHRNQDLCIWNSALLQICPLSPDPDLGLIFSYPSDILLLQGYPSVP